MQQCMHDCQVLGIDTADEVEVNCMRQKSLALGNAAAASSNRMLVEGSPTVSVCSIRQ